MRFSKKIALIAAMSFFCLVLIGGLSMAGLNQLGKSIVELVESDFPLAQNVADVEILQLEQAVSLERTILDAFRHGTDNTEYRRDVQVFFEIDQRIAEKFSEILTLFAESSKNSQGSELSEVASLFVEVEKAHSDYSKQVSAFFDDIESRADFSLEEVDQKMRSLLDKEEHLAKRLAEINHQFSQYAVARGKALEELEVRWLQIITSVVALMSIGCAVVFSLIYFSVKKQLGVDPEVLVEEVQKITAGNLVATNANSAQEHTGVYASVCSMRERLAEIIGEAVQISLMVRRGTGELSVGNMGLSERTEQQAASLEETSSSAEQIAATVRLNADNAKSASSLADNTARLAEGGGRTATAAVDAMEGISSSSEQISEISSVIDEIAFQTNLLALNAAVEAARAGEQGRGFAVVASEVRQLAGRSASAAKEIKELIETSVQQIQGGTSLVRNTGDELQKIVASVNELTKFVTQITVASEQQSVEVDQINQALMSLDTSTQQNTALVEEAAATSESLSELASQLDQKVSYFSVA